jgi:hypothetical protein
MLIRPLFDFTLPIYEIEPAESRKLLLQRLLKKTFKSFTQLSRTTPDGITSALCGYDLDSRAKLVSEREKKKWALRLSRTTRGYSRSLNKAEVSDNDKKENHRDICKEIPNCGVEYINLMTKLCPHCPSKKIMSREHLSATHDIDLPDPTKLFVELQNSSRSRSQRTRTERMWYIQSRIKRYLNVLYEFTERKRTKIGDPPQMIR